MEAAQLLIAPEVRRHLGEQATADVARHIQPSGDCVVCHTTLTDVQVTLTVHAAATDPLLVLPAHASCQPSSLITHPAGRRPAPPPGEYHLTAFVLPAEQQVPAGGQRPAVTGIPAILVNPQVDVQIGDVVAGRWQPWWQDVASIFGLVPLTADEQFPPYEPMTWSVEVVTTRGRRTLVLNGRSLHYQLERIGSDFVERLRYARRCLVLVSDAVAAGPVVDGSLLIAAAQAGSLYGAWAALGAPGSVAQFPEPEQADVGTLAPPGVHIVRSSGDLEAVLADVDVCGRATFSDDPAVRLSRNVLPRGAKRLPVLLLEPRMMIGMGRGDSGVRTEARVEGAIGSGMHRMSSTDTILSAARDWTVRPIADGVELANPFGQVLASASLALSTQWHQEADRAGQVAVIYGPMVGVRSPQGRAYHDADRFAELRDACLRGFVAAALVNWSADDRPFDSPTSAQRRPGWPLQPDEETLLAEKKVSRLRTVRLTVSDALSDTIAPEHLQPLLTHLWPVNCQTCSYALGAHADINVDAERRDELVVTMHHGTCRPSGTHGTTLTRPTRAIAVGRVPMDAEPSAADLPTVVINPSCEQLLLARDRNGGWRDATLDRFKRLRFAAPGPQFPRQARHTSVQLVGDGLEITVTGRRTGASRWSLDSCPAEVREQIERVSGIAVVLTTAVLPTRLTLAELEAALTDPESLVAWVRLRHS